MNAALTSADLLALSPLLILLWTALIVLMVEAFSSEKTRGYPFYITLIGFVFSLGGVLYAPVSQSNLLTPWIAFDSLSLFFSLLFIAIGIACTLLTASFFRRFKATEGEYYFLLLAAVFGLILIGVAADFLTLFLGLETLSIALYVLCCYMKKWEFSSEAAISIFLQAHCPLLFCSMGLL